MELKPDKPVSNLLCDLSKTELSSRSREWSKLYSWPCCLIGTLKVISIRHLTFRGLSVTM